jgi:FkbM family methyltransferase
MKKKLLDLPKKSNNTLFEKNGYHIKDCKEGSFILRSKGSFVGHALDQYGEYSPGEVQVFEQLIKPGDVVIDAGANIGAFTLAFSRIVGDTGTVYAFEAQNYSFCMLCTNLLINKICNVKQYLCGLSDKKGSFLAFIADENYKRSVGDLFLLSPSDIEKYKNFPKNNIFTIKHGSETIPGKIEEIPLTTIDSLDLKHCNFIKADVEGMEEQVLLGAEKTIKKFNPILYVECDRQEQKKPLLSYLKALEYTAYFHKPKIVDLKNNYYNNKNNYFEKNYISINLLCFPKGYKKNDDQLTINDLYPL